MFDVTESHKLKYSKQILDFCIIYLGMNYAEIQKFKLDKKYDFIKQSMFYKYRRGIFDDEIPVSIDISITKARSILKITKIGLLDRQKRVEKLKKIILSKHKGNIDKLTLFDHRNDDFYEDLGAIKKIYRKVKINPEIVSPETVEILEDNNHYPTIKDQEKKVLKRENKKVDIVESESEEPGKLNVTFKTDSEGRNELASKLDKLLDDSGVSKLYNEIEERLLMEVLNSLDFEGEDITKKAQNIKLLQIFNQARKSREERKSLTDDDPITQLLKATAKLT